MLHDIKKLEGYAVGASDGELGTVKDLYFDDQHWAIRYLVVEAGGWLSGRKVLISPGAVIRVAWDEDTIDVRLTRQQVRDSPSIDTDKPVSRQHEMEFSDYYGYPYYWEGTYLWGPLMYPFPSVEPPADSSPVASSPGRGDTMEAGKGNIDVKPEATDSHLRSGNDVIGHEAMATDGPIGGTQGFVFDDESWSIRHLVVNTANWLRGKRVLLSPHQIQHISWPEREVYLDITRQAVKASPEYTEQFVATLQTRD